MLLIGLILLLNVSSVHIPRNAIYNSGDVSVNETYCYVISIAPVGHGNITVGFFRALGSAAPENAPSGLFKDFVTLPVQIEVKDTENKTLINNDIVTPGSFPVDFKTRGEYKVYLTNEGNESSPIPIGVQFEEGNLQNREADKYILAETLTLSGATVTIIGITLELLIKQRQKIQMNN